MPFRLTPAQTPVRRKKTIIQKWKQMRRIKSRARWGPPNRAFVKEFGPIVKRYLEFTKTGYKTPEWESLLDSVNHDFATKIREWAIRIALRSAGIFSAKERAVVGRKMNYFLSTTNNFVNPNLEKGLVTTIGVRRSIVLMREYKKAATKLKERTKLLVESLSE